MSMVRSDNSNAPTDGPALRRLAERQKHILDRIADLERVLQELKLGGLRPAGSLTRMETDAEDTRSPEVASRQRIQADLTGPVGGHANAEDSAAVSSSERSDLAGTSRDGKQNGQEQIVQSETKSNGLLSRAQLPTPKPTPSEDEGSTPSGVQTKLNGSITHGTADGGEGIRATQQRLEKICRALGCQSVRFKAVPEDYYERSLEERRDLLGAPSVDHLCKSIVMTNTQAPADVVDCSNSRNSKYYVVVVQYVAKLNTEKLKNFVYGLNEGKLPKKRINMRLAPSEVSDELTGYTHNSVTPFGMRTDIPVILSDAITNLSPPFFWLGAGEVDLKLGLDVSEFVDAIKPFIADCT